MPVVLVLVVLIFVSCSQSRPCLIFASHPLGFLPYSSSDTPYHILADPYLHPTPSLVHPAPRLSISPDSAMQRHLDVNKLDQNFHLFGYSKKGRMVPLTKKTFQKRLADATAIAGLLSLHGHSICIGSTLKYLLRGVPFDVMKIKGRWSSNAFHKYLQDHAKVLAPYMQAAPPEIHNQFIQAVRATLRRDHSRKRLVTTSH